MVMTGFHDVNHDIGTFFVEFFYKLRNKFLPDPETDPQVDGVRILQFGFTDLSDGIEGR